MPEKHIEKPGFFYTACRSITKHKEKYKKLQIQEIQDIFIEMNQK